MEDTLCSSYTNLHHSSSGGSSLIGDTTPVKSIHSLDYCQNSGSRGGNVSNNNNNSNGRTALHKMRLNGTSANVLHPHGPYKFGMPAELRSSYNERGNLSRSHAPRTVPSHQHVNKAVEKSPQRSQSERTNRWVWDDGSHVHAVSPLRTGANGGGGGLYRSNSSLDLDDMIDERSSGLRREYGSASSIDLISTTGESFFAMLRDFQTDNVDQRSPGPAKIADYLRGRVDCAPTTQNASNALANGADVLDEASSPKMKSKFHRLWETKDKSSKSKSKSSGNSEPSIFRKLRGTKGDATVETSSKGSDNSLDLDAKLDEKYRRKAFAHYDMQSMVANLSYAARLRGFLSKRRNTATGASAASMSNRTTPHGSTEDLGGEETDAGDGRSNDLVLSCPFFRNELGGEEERVISLTRATSKSPKISEDLHRGQMTPFHKPAMVCGISVLEGAADYYWKKWNCPYQTHSLQIENVDQGVAYYRQYFCGKEHQNWFGIDENLGPVAISILREKIEENSSSSNSSSVTVPTVTTNIKDSGSSSSAQYRYRLIIRTSELSTLRGSVLEDAIPTIKPNSNNRTIPTKEVLEYMTPEIQLSCLHLSLPLQRVEEQLVKLDQQGVTNNYKVGIMYCKAGQSTEEEMYNNECSGPAFDEFLDMLGQRIRLKGFDKYRAQLDNKTDSTGLYSVYAAFQDCEIMFHVSTLLPYTANNRQQLLRKRHIGNDIVTIVFQEPDARPFTPKNIRSQFQHVFIIIRAIQPCTDKTHYKVMVSRSKDVQTFGPPIPPDAIFPKSKAFADFLLAKIINAENAAHKSEKFATMATRTRQEYLKDLATNYVTNTTVDFGSKFSVLSFGVRKKEKPRPRFYPDACVKGAIVWQIQVEDYGQACVCNCFLGLSSDTLILIEESTREPVFVCPISSVLGWSSQTNSLKIYYHQGECVVLRSRDSDIDEIQEIVSRLSCVSQGCETQEFTLKRNNLGQLGFHVQHDGTITEVETYGFAWHSGVRQGSRLVEICKVVVSAMTHDQMVDLLKTSSLVTITVIPPFQDGNPRRGCCLHNCSYLLDGCTISDYENVGNNMDVYSEIISRGKSRSHQQQTAQSQSKAGRYIESTTSTPHSTTSSGYSGSSSRSGMGASDPHLASTKEVNSSSSQSSEEKWYDVNELLDADTRGQNSQSNGNSRNASPPPLPARLMPNTHSAFSQVKPKRHQEHSRHQQQQQQQQTPSHHEYKSHGTGYSLVTQHHAVVRSHGHETHSSSSSSSYTRSERQLESVQTLQKSDYSSVGFTSSDYVQHSRLQSLRGSTQHLNAGQDVKLGVLASPAIVISDGHSDSSSDRFHGTRSEDEQSGSSNSLSPRSRRRWPKDGWGTGSSGSSRTHSPRTAIRGGDSTDVKLRPNTNNRTQQVNRNSGQISSTFQEDLLKLINPDLINTQDENKMVIHNMQECSLPQKPLPPLVPAKPNLDAAMLAEKFGAKFSDKVQSNSEADVIFTTARPATVISTASSISPAPSENKLSKEERLSPRVHANASIPKLKPLQPSTCKSESIMPLPEAKDIDWPSLVDTATKAMQVVGVPLPKKCSRSGAWITEVTDRLGLDPLPATKSFMAPTDSSHRLCELESRVQSLEQELKHERHLKEALESEVQSLRQENLRLQEESQTAAAQLRRFTEWFFQTIDRQ